MQCASEGGRMLPVQRHTFSYTDLPGRSFSRSKGRLSSSQSESRRIASWMDMMIGASDFSSSSSSPRSALSFLTFSGSPPSETMMVSSFFCCCASTCSKRT